MKIKLAILEKDQNCLNKIVTAFSTKYAKKLEIYSFTDLSIALPVLNSSRIDVFVASDEFDIDTDCIPEKCGFAYLVDSFDVDNINNQPAICKFQKADLIYKQILDIYYEKTGNTSAIKMGDKTSEIIAFCSVSGGTGASSMAAAAAIHFADSDKNTLYLNLEKFGSADTFFSGEGQYDMSDVIFAIKSKNPKLALRLDDYVKQDDTGVHFYSQAKLALNMYELNTDDIISLISEIKKTGTYDYIIVDTVFGLDKDTLKILDQMNALIFVGDGSEISNDKIYRAYQSLVLIEQNTDISLTDKLYLIYNKFSNKSSQMLADTEIKHIGGSPRYKHATCSQIIDQLSKMDFFSKII